MREYVKYTDDWFGIENLTYQKEYIILKCEGEHYHLINDGGEISDYHMSLFSKPFGKKKILETN